MAGARYYIQIKDKEVPVIVRNYKNSNSINIFFRGNILNISKPLHTKNDEMMKIIKENEEKIYNQYLDIIENSEVKKWENGEKILYKGEMFGIERYTIKEKRLKINLDTEKKLIKIYVAEGVSEEQIKDLTDRQIKKIFKNNTEVALQEKLPYCSKITNIEYDTYKVNDTISKFGSCKPSQKALYFSSRLIMLPEDKMDAIIVHELCHMIHANHGEEFYDLVKKYIPNYEEIDLWLRENSKLMII